MSQPARNAKEIFLAALDLEPAERAGLLVHDVLVSLDGRPLKLPKDLAALVAAANRGQIPVIQDD